MDEAYAIQTIPVHPVTLTLRESHSSSNENCFPTPSSSSSVPLTLQACFVNEGVEKVEGDRVLRSSLVWDARRVLNNLQGCIVSLAVDLGLGLEQYVYD